MIKPAAWIWYTPVSNGTWWAHCDVNKPTDTGHVHMLAPLFSGDDLPVEALEAAIRSMEDVEFIEQDEATHGRFIKQLRDLLLAIRGEKS